MKNRYYLLFIFFFSILFSKQSSAWCGDSVRVVVERYCDWCEPRYETIYHYDSLARIEDYTVLMWNGVDWENNYRYVYTFWNDTLTYETEYDVWQNGAWSFYGVYRTTYNNHGLVIQELDSFIVGGMLYKYVRDTLDNIIENSTQHWNGYEWINNYRTLYWYDSQSRDTLRLAQTGDSISWIDNYRYIYHFDAFGNSNLSYVQHWNGSQWLNNYKGESWFIGVALDTLIITQNGDSLSWKNNLLHRSAYDTLFNRVYELYQTGNDTLWINEHQIFYSYHDTLIDSSLTQWWDTTSGWFNTKRDIYTRDSLDRITEQLTQNWQDTVWVNYLLHLNYYLANGRIDYETDDVWDGSSWSVDCIYTPTYDSLGVLTFLHNSCWFYGCTSNENIDTYDADGILIHRLNIYTSCGGGDEYTYYDYYYNLASGDSVICDSGAATISVANCVGYFYLWNTGDTTATITVSDSGIYTVEITDSALHHIYTQPFYVYVVGSASATHTTDSVLNICGQVGEDLNETIIPYASYQWIYNDSILISTSTSQPYHLYLNPTALSSGSYRVVVITGCGIDTSSATIVNFDSLMPVNHITSSGDTNFCAGQSITLSSDSIFDSYLWSPTNDTTQSINVTSSGTYRLVASNSQTCRATSNIIHVAVSDTLNASITAVGNIVFCSGESVSLVSDTFPTVHWSTGDSSLMISVSSSGAYFAIVENAIGCADTTNVIDVVVNSLPVVSIGNDTTICITQSITFDAGNGFTSYHWQDSSSSQYFTASSPIADTMQLYVTVTDSNSCSNTDTIQVLFDICAGINSISEKQLQIYPNPTNNTFTIKNISKNAKALLEIFNPIGEMVYTEKLFGMNEYVVDANLPKGIYFVRVNDSVRRLVVE